MNSMKIKIPLFISALVALFFSACEDKDYPLGLPEYEHHYYISYVPYNNAKVSVNKNQAALVKFPVQFHSSFIRNYDAVGHYTVVQPATGAAVLGQDFNIVDKNGTVIQPVDGKFTLTFPQAKKVRDTIYVKLLNNPTPGTRTINIDLMENVTPQFRVDTMSTSFRRPLEIK